MKKLQKLSLMSFSQTEMEKRQLNTIRGGWGCPMDCDTECACAYAGEQEGPDDSYYGGSSSEDNSDANSSSAYDSMTNDAGDDY